MTDGNGTMKIHEISNHITVQLETWPVTSSAQLLKTGS